MMDVPLYMVQPAGRRGIGLAPSVRVCQLRNVWLTLQEVPRETHFE